MKITLGIILIATSALCGAQVEREADTPTIADTVAYINANTVHGVTLHGTLLEAPNSKWNRQIDLLNAEATSTSADPADQVYISCKGMTRCINSDNKRNGASEEIVIMKVLCTNATIAPHVAKALNHLIRLIQQQAESNQPF